ncbi:MAG: iron ABC transporter permease [Candidatus Methylarchaceae archaeon HK02M2]|nr:iron ABC transporter permease [Candidatus Methylarchaceae archaeon HK02M2]
MTSEIDVKNLYRKIRSTKILFLLILTLALVIVIIFSICLGPVSISIQDIIRIIFGENSDETVRAIILDVRIPRVLMAFMAGTCLSLAGAVMQGLLRNPLASPYVLGVASGAAFGAALAVTLGLHFIIGEYALFILALIFALVTMFMVYGLASTRGVETETLILAGIAIGSLFNALVSFLIYISGEKIYGIVFWLMGGLWGADWEQLFIIFPVFLGGIVITFNRSWDLNALSMGDEVAINLGINVKSSKIFLLTLATLLTAVTISLTGTIGFIGLVAPHIVRMMIGSDHRFLLPASSLVGAILLLFSDTLSRMIINPSEIPVGIITSIIGVPFFVYLLMKRRKSWWR